MEEDEVPFEEDAPKQSKPKKSKSEVEIDDKLDKGEFLEIGSPQATLRLIRDLKSIKASKPEQLGFDANPFKSKQGKKKSNVEGKWFDEWFNLWFYYLFIISLFIYGYYVFYSLF